MVSQLHAEVRYPCNPILCVLVIIENGGAVRVRGNSRFNGCIGGSDLGGGDVFPISSQIFALLLTFSASNPPKEAILPSV